MKPPVNPEKLTISKCEFVNCETAVITSIETEVIESKFVRCKTAIDAKDSRSLLDAMGLRTDTPPEVLAEILKILNAGPRREEDISTSIQKSSITRWLDTGASVATVTQALVALWNHKLVDAALRVLNLV